MILFGKKQEVIEPYTVEQCSSCSATKKRKFAKDDYVFKETSKCASCNSGQMMIARIYGEVLK